MNKENINGKKVKPIIYIAVFLSVIALALSGYGLATEGTQDPQEEPQGLQGPQGIQGIQGEPGPQGMQGIQGPSGEGVDGDSHSLDTQDGSILDVVYVDNNANVGVGTLNPNEKLDIDGNVQISGDYKYSSAKTYYYSIPPCAFNQLYGADDDKYYMFGGPAIISTVSSPYLVHITSPIYLPDGARITEITAYYYDGDGTYSLELTIYLIRHGHDGLTSNMAEFNEISGVIPFHANFSEDTIFHDIVDTKNYQYYVQVDFEIGGNSASLNFNGCRIEYTMDTI